MSAGQKKQPAELFDVRVAVDPNYGAIIGRNGTFTIHSIRIRQGRNSCFYIDGCGKAGRMIRGGLSCDKHAAEEIGTALHSYFVAANIIPDGSACPYCNGPWIAHDGDGSCEAQRRALAFHCPSCDADLAEEGVIVVSHCEQGASAYVDADVLHVGDCDSPDVTETESICCHSCGEPLPDIMQKQIVQD